MSDQDEPWAHDPPWSWLVAAPGTDVCTASNSPRCECHRANHPYGVSLGSAS